MGWLRIDFVIGGCNNRITCDSGNIAQITEGQYAQLHK